MGLHPNIHGEPRSIHYEQKESSRKHTAHWNAAGEAKENDMNGPEIMLVMLVARLVIPLGLLLWIGEGARRRNTASFHNA